MEIGPHIRHFAEKIGVMWEIYSYADIHKTMHISKGWPEMVATVEIMHVKIETASIS